MKRPELFTITQPWLFCLVLLCVCQVVNCAPKLTFSRDYFTRFNRLTTKEGLSSDKVLDILQDRYGVMWFATVNGLTMFDGSHYRIYYHVADDPHSLSCNEVTSLAEDIYGNLWIGTSDGLNRYDRKSNTFLRYNSGVQPLEGLRDNHVKALNADKSGYLWVETAGGFLSRFCLNTQKWESIKHFSAVKEGDYYYWHIFESSRRDFWIGGRASAPLRVLQKNMKDIQFPVRNKEGKDLEGSCFVETWDKKLLCPCNGYLQCFDVNTNSFEILSPIPLEATCAILDDEKHVWIGGSSGLLRLDENMSGGVLYENTPKDDLSLISNSILCLYKAVDGTVWIGTDKGVCFYSKSMNLFRYYRKLPQEENSFSSDKITALMQDRDGLLWVGTEENGVDTFSVETERVGNLTYNLLTKSMDEATFYRERKVLNQYALHQVIVSGSSDRCPVFTSYRDFQQDNLRFASLNENNVSALYQDKAGIIYIGLWSHIGFNAFNKETGIFKRYALWSQKPGGFYPVLFIGNPFGSNWYAGFLEDSQSRFWCATWEGLGLNLFDRKKGRFLGKHYMPANVPGYPRSKVESLALDTINKRVYLGGGGIYYGYYDYIANAFKRYGEILPSDYPNKKIINEYYSYSKAELIPLPMDFRADLMLFDGQGHVWLGSGMKIIKHTLSNNKIETVVFSNKGDLSSWGLSRNKHSIFIGQSNRIDLLSIASKEIQPLLTLKGRYALRQIKILYEDSARRLWIGTDEGLLVYDLSTRILKPVFQKNGKEYQRISAITDDDAGRIIIGYIDGVAILEKGKILKAYSFNGVDDIKLPGNVVHSFYIEEHNKLWICTNDGLVCCEGEICQPRITVFRHDDQKPHSLLDNGVRAVMRMPDSLLWVATNGGICVYHPSSKEFEDKSQPGNDCLTSRLTSCIMEDSSGNIWVGTTERGLNVLHTRQDTISHYIHRIWDKKGIPNNYIGCLFEDSRHQVWIGTNKGLCRFVSSLNNFEHIEGLQERQIRGICEDKFTNLWVSTDKGLYWVTRAGHIRRCFYDYHGLQGNDFSGASCHLSDGRLAFGGDYGFNLFSPEELNAQMKPKPVVFSNFKVRDTLRHVDMSDLKVIRLPYQDHSFSVDFTATDYVFGPHLKYRYRLLPFEADWVYTDPPFLTAKYTNLSAGHYTLEVEVSNQYGEWLGIVYSFSVEIDTPWYLQWWFFGLFGMLLIGTVFLIIRYREKRLRKANIQLERLVSERTEKLREMADSKTKFLRIISHDLKNSIVGLEKLSRSLDEQYDEFDDCYKRKGVSLFHKTSTQVRLFLEKLLTWGAAQNMAPCFESVNLSKHVDMTFEHLQMMADEKKIQLINSISDDIYVDTDRNMLSTILQNLISNAIKYSWRKGRIVLSALSVDNVVEVRITDQGIGMNEDRVRKLFRIDSKLQTHGTEKEQGTGLGLIIVHELIQQLKENIWVESQLERGTVFIFTLPKNIKN